jgi:hypothetical protein
MKKILTTNYLFSITGTILSCMLFVLFAFGTAHVQAADPAAIIGHWDLTVDNGGQPAPSWLEVKLSGIKTLVGHFVSTEGSARPIAKVNFENGKVNFSIPPQWEMGAGELVFEGTLENDKLTGTITTPMGAKHTFTGVRAPSLVRSSEPVWDKPMTLLNGKDLEGWVSQLPQNQWVIENGVLKSPKSGSNLMTTAKFTDFKLHAEFRYPAGSNSGIYLRGRYELQIVDSYEKEPSSIYFGGIYGFLTPNENMEKAAGEWQTYDITLIGRRVTVIANGKTVICDQIIPGITGGAMDSREDEPGPILLQGDHGPVEYRNMIITRAK